MSPSTIGRVRNVVFAVLAATFLGIALLAALRIEAAVLVGWVSLLVGVLGALVLFGVAALAPPRATAIAYDEGHDDRWLRAQALGYWAAVFVFAICGNLVSVGWLDLPRAFVCGGMVVAATPFVRFLAGEWAPSR